MTNKNYRRCGEYNGNDTIYGYHIRNLIGKLLFEERRKKNKTIEQISIETKIFPRTIDEIEIARCKPH